MRQHYQELIRAVAVATGHIRLLDRATPLNAHGDLQRLIRGWEAGATPEPESQYLPAFDPTELLKALEALIALTSSWPPADRLLAARLEELHTEARLSASVGSASFRALALQRYHVSPAASTARADQLASDWLTSPTPPDGTQHVSDDERDPNSLLRRIQARLAQHRLSWRVTADACSLALATVAPGIIRYRPGVRLGAALAHALAIHEVDGHAVPHARAKKQTLLLAQIGSAHGLEDQEGRAVHLEASLTGLPAARRRSLAARHLAASACRAGASYVECVRDLIGRGSSSEDATRAAYRVFRGGGLAREIVYLPGYLAFGALTQQHPRQAAWMNVGAIGFEAARLLTALGLTPEDDSHDPAAAHGSSQASAWGRGPEADHARSGAGR